MKLDNVIQRISCSYQLRKYRLLFGKKFDISNRVFVRRGFSVSISDGAQIRIGNDVFFNNYCSINAMKSIVIGADCLFGENVKIYDHNHVYTDQNTPIRNQGFNCKNVIIGDNCWICSNVIILPGTVIGDHCVIGANCVVHGIIPNNTILRNEGNYIIKNIL